MLYLAIGRRELGKTTLVTSLARRVPQRIFLDPRRMIRNSAARVISNPEEIGAAVYDLWENPESQQELVISPAPRVRPAACFTELCNSVADWIVRDDTAPLAVVFDEMRFVKDVADRSESFDFLLRGTPRDVVHIFMTCHRPTDVPVNVRAIVDHWLLFQCSQAHDLEDIRKIAGPEAVAEIQRLQPYEWLQWDDSKGAARLHKTPSAWYVPLKETASGKGAVDTFAGLPSTDPMSKGRLFG